MNRLFSKLFVFQTAMVATAIFVALSVEAIGQESKVPAEQVKIIEAIKEAGGKVYTISAEGPQREVAFHLSPNPITDEHLKLVSQLDHVAWLNLAGTKISDQGLEAVEGLQEITRLHLEKTTITDEAIPHLLKLIKLEYLNLYGTHVTDQGIQALAELEHLNKLYVWQSKVTDAGIQQLVSRRPDLQVVGELKLELTPPNEPETEASRKGESEGEKKDEEEGGKTGEKKESDKESDKAPDNV